ncbi:hypothetical protein KQY27_06880 [Methanobrevibacter sp. TMH8]|uniref:hypothetical protein n=1 Tax=Methanobrevibacter sp. TMH8 TaxID=2848611 RepID=UPI001CCF3791|nr:hypothetical protein [Methanobrevibacter sp. TMH8]MBZ9571265.1 hypothetical protein [Methanobrevibacter sp. TMH8]
MNKKVILLIGIFILFFAFVLNTSFATSNETIDKYKVHQIESYNKKIINLNHVSEWNHNYNGKNYLIIKVKKAYESKYKIKLIKVKYIDNGEVKYKTYNIKNKIKAKLSIKKVSINKLAIIYKTKGKIKKETLNLETKHKWKSISHFYGKNANISLKEMGYIEFEPGWGGYMVTNYQKLKIVTKSIKYKIKNFKVFLFNPGGIELVKDYNGYGKTKLTTRIYGPSEGSWVGGFRIYYY